METTIVYCDRYPYLDEIQIQGLYQRLEFLELGDILVAEFGVAETNSLETSGRVPFRDCIGFVDTNFKHT